MCLNIPRQLIKQNDNKIVIKMTFDPAKKNASIPGKMGEWDSATAYCGENKLQAVKYTQQKDNQKAVSSAVQ